MSRRTQRVNELLRDRLAELLQRGLKDPRVKGLVTITSVEVALDFSTARVFVSVLGTPQERKDTLEGLRSAAGFLHRSLDDLALRRVPDLLFMADDSIERGDRLSRILGQIRSEGQSAP